MGRSTYLLAAVVLIAPVRAAGSPLFELSGDVQGGGGLTARLNADGPAAAYFNPALLVDAPHGVVLGVFFLADSIGIGVDGRLQSPVCEDGTCDVPSVSGRGPESFRHEDGEPISDPTMPTEWLQDGTSDLGARPRQGAGSGTNRRAYQTLGLVTSPIKDRLTLGLYAMIPLGEFTTTKAFYNDEREQFFSNSLHPELYSDRLTATSLAFGAGVRVHPTLSLGLSFTLSLANEAQAPVYVSNLNDLDTVLLDSDISVQTAVAPHFGLHWKPLRRLRAAATVHTKQAFEVETGFDYVLATGQEQSASLRFVHSYVPLTVAAGGSYDLGETLSLSGLASWAQWSHYEDRHGENPGGAYEWSDELSFALGARWASGKHRVWLDAAYQPSPVPAQTGASNYVDGDRLGVSLGGDRVMELWGVALRIGIDALGHRILQRSVDKDPESIRDEVPDDSIDVLGQPVGNREGLQTNNPGFPGFSVDGWIFGAGLRVGIEY
jgi:long-chain fatty acid transport protein